MGYFEESVPIHSFGTHRRFRAAGLGAHRGRLIVFGEDYLVLLTWERTECVRFPLLRALYRLSGHPSRPESQNSFDLSFDSQSFSSIAVGDCVVKNNS